MALNLRPDFTPLHVALANLLSQGGDPDSARRHYEIAQRQDPGSPLAWSGMGSLLMAQGFYEDALIKFNNSLKINPKTLYP
ncbi:MAG: tetratricopeptide repeat protein [Alphaproteobacteria bacterium]